MNDRIQLYLINNYEIKKELNPNFSIKDYYERQGSYSRIFNVCDKNDVCNYIVKILPARDDFIEPNCYTEKDLAMNEIFITTKIACQNASSYNEGIVHLDLNEKIDKNF